MDSSLMSVIDSGRKICAESESSCLLQDFGSCIDDGVDICTVKFTVIIFPMLALLIGAICMLLAKRFHVTYHLLVLGAGVSLGLLGCGVDLGLLSISLRQWVHVNPPAILLYMFLAPLVFAASFNTSWHVFKRLIFPILISALVILSLQVGLIGAFQMIVIRTEGWSWWSALMFGSLLSATDSIAVTTPLNVLGASPLLGAFIDGESLVSFGSSIVLWVGFFINAQIDFTADGANAATSSVGELIGDVFKLILGGVAIGVAFALVVLIILSFVYDEFEVETSLTVVVAFLGFWTAQALSELSGVTANVASGLLLSAFGRQLITPSVRKPLGEFWNLLGWIGSTIIFAYAGLLLSAFAWSCAGEPHLGRDYVYIIVWYIFLQVVRIVLFLIFQPVLAFRNKWLGWKEAFFFGFSGIRGALSLLLALEVAGSPALPEEVKSRVVLWTTGVVALTLLINGFLLKPVIHALKFDDVQKPKDDFLQRARTAMVQRTLEILDHLCIEPGYKSVRWSYVIENVLPSSWLLEAKDVIGNKVSVPRLENHVRATRTAYLEGDGSDEGQRITHGNLGDYGSEYDLTSRMILQHSQRPSSHLTQPDFHQSVQNSMSITRFRPNPVSAPAARENPQVRRMTHPNASESSLEVFPSATTPVSRNSRNEHNSEGGPRRRNMGEPKAGQKIASEPIDVQRQRPNNSGQNAKDREVHRRMLTALLSHIRAITNASLVTYSVLVHLEEDIQNALDANAEGNEYDLFSFLTSVQTGKASIWRRGYLHLIESKKLRGESLMTKTVVVVGILTSVLNGKILLDAPNVRKQMQQLYDRATTLLTRLEALNRDVLGWVTSQFAIHLTEHSQDSALSALLASGVVDEHEFNIIHAELVQVRRKHVNSHFSLMFRPGTLPEPKSLSVLREHPLFAGLNSRLLSQVLDQHGVIVDLQGGEELQVEEGSLVLVLQGAIQPTEDSFHLIRSDKQQHSSGVSVLNTKNSVDVQGLRRFGESLQAVWGSSNGEVRDEAPEYEVEAVEGHYRSKMHWCFLPSSAFCGHSVILDSYNVSGMRCAIDRSRLFHTRFRSCVHANLTTVFTLPAKHVKALACVNEDFRLEMTRSLAREIVLNSVVDRSPYALTNYFQFTPTDANTVIGRAFQILERLPYMQVVTLRAGSSLHVRGPAVLLNGTVQVSIDNDNVDGPPSSAQLLHEELTGPALLPSTGSVLEEVPSKHKQTSKDNQAALQRSSTSSIEFGAERRTVAHILTDTLQPGDNAVERLRRWARSDVFIDMNGRFGIHSHMDLAPLWETRVE
ncbi:Sodium/hydrogen exchanger [Gracilaria domingensis]|nr:Sodium/hydrogen exchanger [Gracilaria domingensis]